MEAQQKTNFINETQISTINENENENEQDDFDFEDENDSFWDSYKESRMAEIKKRINIIESHGNGGYIEIFSEKEFVDISSNSQKLVCHFYHKQFTRCLVIDKHLSILADKYNATKFVKIDALQAPFFTDRLKIRVLPCVLSFVGGIVVDRLVGFEELGNRDDFKTQVVERRLLRAGVITKVKKNENSDSEDD
eukprot:TRINITY_DN181_c1_g4_i1.p1 TRINITY_DN181_c1_g4~~TRINITY_DN181_c1_g4_i1.p1  ORF type:complete len:193 (+),score=82.12 TRINITY_DN181_c1_g4_i1:65-643(+)